jgi:hypothetical protein
MRAVQSYPYRQPALRMLPDHTPANAAFVALCPPVESANETTAPGRPGFRCGEMHRNQAASPFVFLAYESFQDKTRNGSRCDCGRPNRRQYGSRSRAKRKVQRLSTIDAVH